MAGPYAKLTINLRRSYFGVPVTPHPHQNLALMVFLILAIVVGV